MSLLGPVLIIRMWRPKTRMAAPAFTWRIQIFWRFKPQTWKTNCKVGPLPVRSGTKPPYKWPYKQVTGFTTGNWGLQPDSHPTSSVVARLKMVRAHLLAIQFWDAFPWSHQLHRWKNSLSCITTSPHLKKHFFQNSRTKRGVIFGCRILLSGTPKNHFPLPTFYPRFIVYLVGVWTNPVEKYKSNLESFPPNWGENQNIWNHHLVYRYKVYSTFVSFLFFSTKVLYFYEFLEAMGWWKPHFLGKQKRVLSISLVVSWRKPS